jgi:hypothetical protein
MWTEGGKKADASVARSTLPERHVLKTDENIKGFLNKVGGLEEIVWSF